MSKIYKWRHLTGSDTGPIWVVATEGEIQEFWDASPTNCAHVKSELRDYETSNGGWQRKEQCLTCGASTSQSKARDKQLVVPLGDRKLVTNWEASCSQKRQKIQDYLIDRTEKLEFTGHVFYEEYLKSDEWIKRRNLVLKRDKHLCQCCLEETASEVHHHTYDQIFDEFLFDLVSVCRKCHERVHQKKIAAVEAARAKGVLA